ncbi:hypothetical protein B0T14DRAFT_232329 [Immersiella caudata]|uniref:Uncharacterized protein n=1 Tax=Immersiella caudata TaxID=314043 RepID=A0AA40C0I8_9PEZI|nr:hypothetical protein B0T14DRAFT_232329 [Immersiella caudata]
MILAPVDWRDAWSLRSNGRCIAGYPTTIVPSQQNHQPPTSSNLIMKSTTERKKKKKKGVLDTQPWRARRKKRRKWRGSPDNAVTYPSRKGRPLRGCDSPLLYHRVRMAESSDDKPLFPFFRSQRAPENSNSPFRGFLPRCASEHTHGSESRTDSFPCVHRFDGALDPNPQAWRPRWKIEGVLTQRAAHEPRFCVCWFARGLDAVLNFAGFCHTKPSRRSFT